MSKRLLTVATKASLVGLAAVLLIGCSTSQDSVSRSDIEDMVASAVAGLSDQMLTAEEAERIVTASLEELAERDASVTLADVQAVVSEESASLMAQLSPPVTAAAGDDDAMQAVPSKSAQADYTQYVVQRAIDRYHADGRDAMIHFYSQQASVDGPWYVFIIDENERVVAHPDERRVGLDLNGPVGTDVNGYVFGAEILTATEAGKWVPYVYANPEDGTLGDHGLFELKNTWVVRHDGLLFASGWYIDTEEFAPALISEAAEHFRAGGLEAILAFYNDPLGIATGLIPTAEYYNRTDTLDGYFTGFIAAADGEILSHFDPELIGTDIEDLLGPAVRKATADGRWINAADNPADADGPETMRMWVLDVDGTLLGGGWYSK